ncbi:MAG: hypothetical protein HRT58_05490 [Crocinitomicaceae bacterium]|nr:hypothetical protein [Flavobacteriales bacterium]NQZ35093.1 hypothetical protein [Crocinitomicaceae bacterium]
MKNSKKILMPLLVGVLVILGCENKHDQITCDTVTEIEGEYICTGECIVIDNGMRIVVTVSGETDRIERYPKAKENLYQVRITGNDNFNELEIGAFNGRTLCTATAEVSDSTYPVLEEYIFDTDEFGKAIGFTKIVRNPSSKNFKTCVIYGEKVEMISKNQ